MFQDWLNLLSWDLIPFFCIWVSLSPFSAAYFWNSQSEGRQKCTWSKAFAKQSAAHHQKPWNKCDPNLSSTDFLSQMKKNMFSITIFINPFQLSFAFIWKRNSLKFLKLKLMEYACSLRSFIIQKIGLYWSFKYNAAPQCRNAPLGAEHK